MDYADLKTKIASWLKRSDLVAMIPDFVTLAETKLSEDLFGTNMTTTSTLATVAGVADVALPTDFRSLRSLSLSSSAESATPDYVTPQVLANRNDTASGTPVVYTVIDGNLRFSPAPDAIYSVSLVYECRVPPLSDAALTNWLIERSPNAYLFGSLLMAQPFILKDERMPVFQQMYADAVNGINVNDWHVGGELRVRSDVRSV